MDYSFCTAVGVVESFDSEIRADIRIPVAQLSVFSRETNLWDLSIYVAIMDDADQRKAQGLSTGDIVFFTGKPVVVENRNIIYSDSFVILKKNKAGLPIELCKLSSLEYVKFKNVAAVAGTVCSISDSFVSVMVRREDSYIRGSIREHDIARIRPVNKVDIAEGDTVVCVGSIKGIGIDGMTAVVNNKDESRLKGEII